MERFDDYEGITCRSIRVSFFVATIDSRSRPLPQTVLVHMETSLSRLNARKTHEEERVSGFRASTYLWEVSRC